MLELMVASVVRRRLGLLVLFKCDAGDDGVGAALLVADNAFLYLLLRDVCDKKAIFSSLVFF